MENRIYRLSLYCNIMLLSISTNGFSEGTKQIRPADTVLGTILIYPTHVPFATETSSPEERLYIHISDTSEVIYMGFNYKHEVLKINKWCYTVYDPSGNKVDSSALPDSSGSGTGLIHNYNQAVLGPNALAPGGYTPIVIHPKDTGDYYISFFLPKVSGTAMSFRYFDITVADAAGNVKNGRLWSKAWYFMTELGNLDERFYGKVFVYSDDGVVTELSMNGIQPMAFQVTCNNTGCFNTGNFVNDRKSVFGSRETYPMYKIFLNDPDSTVYPSGKPGEITQAPVIHGCFPDYLVDLSVDKEGMVELQFNLNGVPGYQPGTSDFLVSMDVTAGLNQFSWDGLDGLGNPVPVGTPLDISVISYFGLTNLPLYDIEYSRKGFIVNTIRPSTPNKYPKLYWDDTNIPWGGAANYSGCTSSPTSGCHVWDLCYDSCGTNLDSTLGNFNTVNTWWYSSNSSVELTSWILSDCMHPVSLSTKDDTICNGDSVQLHVMVSGGWGNMHYEWGGDVSTLSAEDIANPAAFPDITTTYTITVTDDSNNVAVDSLIINVKPTPAVDAGDDVEIWEGGSVSLNAAATGASGINFSWDPPAGLDNPEISNPVASPENTTSYTVTAYADGCSGEDIVVVTVKGISLVIYNTFTPNGDNINDTWIIENLDNVLEYEIFVYNRMGNRVFMTDNYQDGWDGKFNNKTLPAGTYYYIIELKSINKVYSGNVTIIK